ncbi:MAG: DUF1003 domain-containing protein [Bdellovibrionota bacterium]
MKESESKLPGDKIDRNIDLIQHVRENLEAKRGFDEKLISKIARFAGSTNSLYIHLFFYSALVFITFHFADQGILAGWPPPSETVALTAALEALFLTILVLINQRHMDLVERKNSDLHLQMSLLTEHEITRLVQVTDLIAKKLGVETEDVEDLDEVKQDVDPEEVIDKIDQHESQSPHSI